METIFWGSAGLILYTYFGYFLILKLLVALNVKSTQEEKKALKDYPEISIVISAFNEEKAIQNRIENLQGQDYPIEKLEIIVASDGSTDDTVKIAGSIQQDNIIVLDFKENRGRALLQNDAVEAAGGDIIILTDAETEFDSNFVRNMVRYYGNPVIGCVVGNLKYKMSNNMVCSDEGLYFSYEKKIRALEDKLGILAKTTGACMSVRKKLWQKLLPTDDADFTTPLDVLLQGYRVAYAEDAIALDFPPSTLKNEFKTRIRQSNKNFYGTLHKWKIKEYYKHPFISWGIVSHKYLKYFVPYFLVIVFASNMFLVNDSVFYLVAQIFQITFYFAALLGLAASFINIRIPLISSVTNFVVANSGIMIGVFKALTGNVYSSYKPLKN